MDNDKYVNPDHYKNEDGTQVIDYILKKIEAVEGISGVRGFLYGSALKYQARAGRKLYHDKTLEESKGIDNEKEYWYASKLLKITYNEQLPETTI